MALPLLRQAKEVLNLALLRLYNFPVAVVAVLVEV
jgi:hypothetical protein